MLCKQIGRALTCTISEALMRRSETSTCQHSVSLFSEHMSRILRRCTVRERSTLVINTFFLRRMSSLQAWLSCPDRSA